jgi:hypothetical protein
MLRDAINTDSFPETRKNELLAYIYAKDHQSALKILNDICSHVVHANTAPPSFSENDEKILNQIILIAKNFAPQMQEHEREQCLYLQKQIKRVLLRSFTKTKLKIDTISFEQWKNRLNLTDLQMKLVFQSTMALQLTKGCSNFCRRCNEWALAKVRAHFSYQAITKILTAINKQDNHEISLYSASDPLDWEEGSKSILDIVSYINKSLSLEYSLLTKVPKGKNRLLASLIQANANISVSMTLRNKKRIQALESGLAQTIAKQHDTNDLLILAYLDEDFLTVKPSITDGYGTEITPDGAFIIIPTFTCALHPFGHKKIPISRETDFFPIKKIARQALLIDYFKPLQGYKLQGHNFKIRHLETLLEVQVETILLDSGKDELTPPGMRSIKEYFSIFDSKARLRRKNMTKTVLKKLKAQYLEIKEDDNTFRTFKSKIANRKSKMANTFKSLSQELQKEYLTKIRAHLDLCKKEKCLEAQKNTASFFLSAIKTYVRNNFVKSRIILHLVRDETDVRQNSFLVKDTEIAKLFLDEKTNAFELFRNLALQILLANQPITRKIEQFIHANPTSYDPAADIFLSTNEHRYHF